MFRIVLLLAASAFSFSDLVGPFTVDVISTKNPLWDTIQVTTYVSNIGTTKTITNTSDFQVASVGIDSFFPLKNHVMPANFFLSAGGLAVFKDTLIAFHGPFAIVTQVDPIHVFQEYAIGNDTRSQGYNFYPTIIRDTLLLVDTLLIHDTVNYCAPSLVKASSAVSQGLATTIYNLAGQPAWTGALPPGGLPIAKLKPGLYLMVQGRNTRRFRIAYR